MDVFKVHKHLIADHAVVSSGLAENLNRPIEEHAKRREAVSGRWPAPHLPLASCSMQREGSGLLLVCTHAREEFTPTGYGWSGQHLAHDIR